MEGGEKVYLFRRYVGKALFFGAFFCVVLFLGSQMNFAVAEGEKHARKKRMKSCFGAQSVRRFSLGMNVVT